MPVSSSEGSTRASGRKAEAISGGGAEGGERLVTGAEDVLDRLKVIVLGNIRVKRGARSRSNADSNVPCVSGPDTVRNEDGARNTVVVEVVKILILRNGSTLETTYTWALGIIRGSLEGRDAG